MSLEVSEDDNLQDLINKYDNNINKNKTVSIRFASELLKEMRKSKIRRPDIILECGSRVEKKDYSSDALDISDTEIADKCLLKLKNKFPKSARVSRLVGMYLEFKGDYKLALELYETVLKENPSNLPILKRKVCVYKALNNYKDMISELNEIIKAYPADSSSWLELGEVQCMLGDFHAAAHCYEELILIEPDVCHFQNKLAETYYTIGGSEYYLNARRHFVMSLNIQKSIFNTRGLYGVIMSCNAFQQCLDDDSLLKDQLSFEKKVNDELLKWAKEQIQEVNKHNNNNECVKLVTKSIM